MTLPFLTPELRAYAKVVESVPDVSCYDCPFATPKKNGDGIWCKPPGYKRKVNFPAKSIIPRPCFTYARLVLKMSA